MLEAGPWTLRRIRIAVALVIILLAAGLEARASDPAVEWEGTSAALIHLHEGEEDGDWWTFPVTIVDVFTGPDVTGPAIATFEARLNLATGELQFHGDVTCHDCRTSIGGQANRGTFRLAVEGAGTLEEGGTFEWEVLEGSGELAGLRGEGSGTFTPVAPLVDTLRFSGTMSLGDPD